MSAEVQHMNGDHQVYDARMEELLRSDAFRDEVEEIVIEQLHKGEIFQDNGLNSHNNIRRVTPISDIRGVDSLNYRKGEKVLRCKVAAFYRLLGLSSTSDPGQQTFISARNGSDEMVIGPEGLLEGEVTAGSLVKVDLSSARVLDEGSTSLDVNHDEVSLHSTLYGARSNINCVVHVTSSAAIAVSVMKQGLLPLCGEAMVLGDITYYDYSGCVSDRSESASIARVLGANSQVMFLRSFGVVVVAETVEEAYKLTSNVIIATEAQMNLIPVGLHNIYLPSQEFLSSAYHTERDEPIVSDNSRRWRYGEMEFEGLMRKLDLMGFCTGYVYHDEVQAVTMSRSVSVADDSKGRHSSLDHRTNGIATPLNQLLMRGRRPEPVVSPNVYWKEESGDPGNTTGSIKSGKNKKMYRWVSSEALSNNSKQRSLSMKNLSPNVFAPQGSNPNELRDKVKEIRKEYFDDTITAGPQSSVLEGVTWEEARLIKEGQLGSGIGNVRVTAASRGVIQREHQGEALFYKNYTLNNPFDRITDEDLEKYKKEVQKKSRKGYGKYAESEPEFLSERRPPINVVRATTPPPKPARMSPVENELQSYTRQQTNRSDMDEPEIRMTTTKPVLAAIPQPRSALASHNQSDQAGPFRGTADEKQKCSEIKQIRKFINQFKSRNGRKTINTFISSKDKDSISRSQSDRFPYERRRPSLERTTLLDLPDNRSATLDSSKENSPYGSLSKDKKKKKGLRLPSFSKKKEKQ